MSADLSLTIETRREELTQIAAAVEAISEREQWPADLTFRANLALEEVVLNIIEHGFDGGLHEIECRLRSEPHVLTIEVSDDGRPFDPLREAPAPDLDAPLEERPVGGLGVHLVRSMTDEMSYRRERDRNYLTLVLRRSE